MDEIIARPQRNAGFYVARVTGAILLLAMSATFFYSAYSKIYSDNAFDNFQWTFLDLGINSIFVAGVIARMMIGLEIMLGLFLLFHIYLKQFTYKAIIAVLLIFIAYLLVVILKQGNTGNCGCFGDKLAMKPLAAIWKNVAMIAVTVLLMFLYPVKPYKYQEYVCLLVGLVAFSTPFLANMMYTGTAPEKYQQPIDLAPLYKYDPVPSTDLRTGKHIIAFMSLTCPHCKKAAYLMQIIHTQHPEIPMFMVIDGSQEYEKQFFDETHAMAIPHLLYRHTPEFMALSGPGVPAIYWVNNSVIEYKSKYAYYQLDPKFMLEWLKK